MSDGLEGLTSVTAVFQSERTILTDWRSIAADLADALTISLAVVPREHRPVRSAAALERYEAAAAMLRPEPLPHGPATHEITYWAWSGDRKTETATSEPRGFTRPGKVRQKHGNRYAMVEAPVHWFEWRRPEGGTNEVRADRLVSVVEIATKTERKTDAERVPDDEIFDGLTGEHISVPEGRRWEPKPPKPIVDLLAALEDSVSKAKAEASKRQENR